MSFVPRLETLPAAQRSLWADLKQVPRHFVLYGGTALALRLGHRVSVDFDFFTSVPVEPARLRADIPFLAGAEVLQLAPNTLSVVLSRPVPVKVSFFGGLTLGRVNEPEWTDDGVLQVASLLDIGGCKMAVLPERALAKDYLDVFALLQAGLILPELLGAAVAVHAGDFNPLIPLKALTYFADGDLPSLPELARQTLRDAAAAVKTVPQLSRLPGGLTTAS